jgi:hypothetical protein
MRLFLNPSAGIRLRFGVLLAVSFAALVMASSAAAATPSMVTGAGYTTFTGLVVLNARTTGAPDQFGTAPATGFIRVSSSWYFGASFTGRVTCIGSLGPGIAVSGILDEPYVADGYVYPNFTFLLQRFSAVPNWYAFFVGGFASAPQCGAEIFLAAGLPGDGQTEFPPFMLQHGNFIVR